MVEVGTVVTRIGTSSYDLGQGVFDNDSCIATADVVTVFFDTKNKKSQELTDELKRILESAM